MAGPTPAFWQERFDKKEIGWDRGGPSPRLLAWLEEGALQPCRIAVPGCGRGWEVAELAQRGFEVTAIDYTPAAVQETRALLKARKLEANVVQADVLAYRPDKPFDAIYEQTCLCALHPDHWISYAQQLHLWLMPGAALWVMFMQAIRPAASETGRIEGPPYHCDVNAMRALFAAREWEWPKPPYAKVPHSGSLHELGLRLVRR